MHTLLSLVVLGIIALGALEAAADSTANCPNRKIVFGSWGIDDIGDIRNNGVIGWNNVNPCECADICRKVGCTVFAYGIIDSQWNKNRCFPKKGQNLGQGISTYFKADGFKTSFDGEFPTVTIGGTGPKDAIVKNCLGTSDCRYVTCRKTSCQMMKGTDYKDTDIGFIQDIAGTKPPPTPKPTVSAPSPKPSPTNPQPSPSDPSPSPDPSPSNDPDPSSTTTTDAPKTETTTSVKAKPAVSTKAGGQTTNVIPGSGREQTSDTVPPSGTETSSSGNSSSGGSSDSNGNRSLVLGLSIGLALLFMSIFGCILFFCCIRRRNKTEEEGVYYNGRDASGVSARGMASTSSENLMMASAGVGLTAGAAMSQMKEKKEDDAALTPVTNAGRISYIEPKPRAMSILNAGSNNSTIVPSPVSPQASSPAVAGSAVLAAITAKKYQKPFTREQYIAAGWTDEQLNIFKPPMLPSGETSGKAPSYSNSEGPNSAMTVGSMQEPVQSG
ncbi:hypothetical protein HDU97_009634 [Phlyctochytrium planicorne]|nr:hypothetical protein HDU97_009634 [Phlyctochytrium planicorne]